MIRHVLAREWSTWLAALMLGTRIPITLTAETDDRIHSRARAYLSSVGVFVGMVAFVAYIATLSAVHHAAVAILFSMLATILLTGALHEDGLADCCDAFGAANSRDEILVILKDSRLGTYGVLGLILIFAIKFVVLTLLTHHTTVLTLAVIFVASHSLSRQYAVQVSHQCGYVRQPGLGNELGKSTYTLRDTLTSKQLALSWVFAIWPTLLLGIVNLRLAAWCVCVTWLLSLALQRYATKRLGGITGDVLGAIQQLTELMFYLVALSILAQ